MKENNSDNDDYEEEEDDDEGCQEGTVCVDLYVYVMCRVAPSVKYSHGEKKGV